MTVLELTVAALIALPVTYISYKIVRQVYDNNTALGKQAILETTVLQLHAHLLRSGRLAQTCGLLDDRTIQCSANFSGRAGGALSNFRFRFEGALGVMGNAVYEEDDGTGNYVEKILYSNIAVLIFCDDTLMNAAGCGIQPPELSEAHRLALYNNSGDPLKVWSTKPWSFFRFQVTGCTRPTCQAGKQLTLMGSFYLRNIDTSQYEYLWGGKD